MKRLIFVLLAVQFLAVNSLFAQANEADFMRSLGKIYVVVAVILAIFTCIVLFLIYLDRKLTRLENQIKEND